jgi:hypothetical protein
MEHVTTEQNNGAKENVKITKGLYSPCIKLRGKRNVRATIHPLFPRRHLLKPQNFSLSRFFKFGEITRFLTICYFRKLLRISMVWTTQKYFYYLLKEYRLVILY